jgi:hypothetical protein
VARTAFAASAALYAVVVLVGAVVLPDQVPVHVAADGRVDRFGTRTELLLAEAGVGLGITVLFGALARVVRRIPLDLVGVPHPEYWKAPEHEGELRRRLATDVLHLGTATLLFLTAVAGTLTHAAVTGADRLGPAVGVLVGAFVLGVLGGCVRSASVGYRPPGPVTRR